LTETEQIALALNMSLDDLRQDDEMFIGAAAAVGGGGDSGAGKGDADEGQLSAEAAAHQRVWDLTLSEGGGGEKKTKKKKGKKTKKNTGAGQMSSKAASMLGLASEGGGDGNLEEPAQTQPMRTLLNGRKVAMGMKK
jgi:hypothetical protein